MGDVWQDHMAKVKEEVKKIQERFKEREEV